LDLEAEARLQRLLVDLIGRGLLSSAHDVSDGGLAVALAESAIIGGIGADVELEPDAGQLFGEAQSRAVVSAAPEEAGRVEEVAGAAGVPVRRLGTVGGASLSVRGAFSLPLSDV